MKPCTAPQFGGFTLEAELGIAKNSSGGVLAHGHHLGWEVKQFAVEDSERIESAKPITMMTPEPECWRTATSGFYKDADGGGVRRAAFTPLHRASLLTLDMIRMPTVIRELKRPEGRAPLHSVRSFAAIESVFIGVHPWLN